MTDEEINAMDAGREMDCLIAVYITGLLPPVPSLPGGHNIVRCMPGVFDMEKLPIPRYSTDIADAWRVVEKWRERTASGYGEMGLHCEGEKETGLWVCGFGICEATAPTAPLAICRAALKANESKYHKITITEQVAAETRRANR